MPRLIGAVTSNYISYENKLSPKEVQDDVLQNKISEQISKVRKGGSGYDPGSVHTVDTSDQRICEEVEAMIRNFLLLLVYQLGMSVSTVLMLITRYWCKFYLMSLINQNSQKRQYFKGTIKIWIFIKKENVGSIKIEGS
jgi:hypothetical protein